MGGYGSHSQTGEGGYGSHSLTGVGGMVHTLKQGEGVWFILSIMGGYGSYSQTWGWKIKFL